MELLHSEYKDRIAHWQRVLAQDFYHPEGEIAFEGFTTMDHLTPEQAVDGGFRPVPVGTVWGHTWEYLWLRATVTLPEETAGKTVAMSLDMGGEATLFVNGQAFGTRRAEWVSVPHHYISDNVLTRCAEPGQKFDLLFEVYAGHYFPDVGGCCTGPVLPGTLGDPKAEGSRTRLGRSTFGVWNEDAYQLWMDVSTLFMLMEELPEDSLRAAKIADGLEEYTRIVDFEQPPAARDESYRKARAALRPLMQAHNGSTAPLMAAIGNSHLDLAWLWPMAETHRKTARTFAAQLRLLDRYPEYRYIQSQPAAYEMCREHYPELYARIKQAVKDGRWIAEGAMYVEPDTNMPSGEALVRQLVLGKRFYKEEFGVDSKGQYSDVYEDLVYYLRSIETPLIILDEAGDLQYEAFLELKALWNATERCCAWYMMGADGLKEKINRSIECRKVGYTEMLSRYGDRYSRVTPDDGKERERFLNEQARVVAQVNAPAGADIARIVRKSGGGLRRVYTEIEKLKRA